MGKSRNTSLGNSGARGAFLPREQGYKDQGNSDSKIPIIPDFSSRPSEGSKYQSWILEGGWRVLAVDARLLVFVFNTVPLRGKCGPGQTRQLGLYFSTEYVALDKRDDRSLYFSTEKGGGEVADAEMMLRKKMIKIPSKSSPNTHSSRQFTSILIRVE